MPVTQAPAGGMISNNTFQGGGKFVARPLQRVSKVMERMRKSTQLGRLSRGPEQAALAPWVSALSLHPDRAGPFSDWLEDHGHHHDDETLQFLRSNPKHPVIARHPESGKVVAFAGPHVKSPVDLYLKMIQGGQVQQPFVEHVAQGPGGLFSVGTDSLHHHDPETGRVIKTVPWRIRDAAVTQEWLRRMAHGTPTRLARFTQEDLTRPAGEPHGETFSMAQLRAIEDHHGIPKIHRLSNKAKVDASGNLVAKTEDVDHFFHHARRAAAKHLPELRWKSDDEAGAIAVDHLGAETQHAMSLPHGADAKVWYGEHVQHLEDVVGKHFGWKKDDPRHTLFKALVAGTSSSQNPKDNASVAFKILKDAGGDFSKLSTAQTSKLAKLHARYAELHGEHPTGFVDPRKDPQGASARYHATLHPHKELRDGYYGAPAQVFRSLTNPAHPMNGKVAAIQKSGKWAGTPEGSELWAEAQREARKTKKEPKKHFTTVQLPVPDEAGHLQPKSWTVRGDTVEASVNAIKSVVNHFKGDHKAAAKWLLTEHPPEEFRAVAGKDADPGYLKEIESRFPGSFALGPKFGPFTLNLHTGTQPDLGKYLTPDMWWARTWNRFLGTLIDSKGEPVVAPRNDKERVRMYTAAKAAAKSVGLTVAELQAVLWYHEQRLRRLFGARADSYSYKDGADAIKNLIDKPSGEE